MAFQARNRGSRVPGSGGNSIAQALATVPHEVLAGEGASRGWVGATGDVGLAVGSTPVGAGGLLGEAGMIENGVVAGLGEVERRLGMLGSAD